MMETLCGAERRVFSRRMFLEHASCFGAMYAVARTIPLNAMPVELGQGERVAPTPLVDKEFALVRKVGDGVYATISDFSKGIQTICNGGFLIGKDAALLVEGFTTAEGAKFQMEALRMVSQVPVKGALDTHYHFDHSMGNAFYGGNGIPLWAHATAAQRIVANYAVMQNISKEEILEPAVKAVRDAKSETEKAHRQSDLNALSSVVTVTQATVLALPNHPVDPAKGPVKIELGGLTAVIEGHPGHSGTDLIVKVPEQNVVYTGDLLFNGWYPVCFDEQATVSGWRETLKKFAAFDKDTIFVPGHGQVCGQEGIATIREVFDDIAGQAEKMHKAGVPAAEAADRYAVPEKFKNFPIFAWGFTIGPAIKKLYQEWDRK